MISTAYLVTFGILIGIWIPVDPTLQLQGAQHPTTSTGCELGPNGRTCYMVISKPLNQTEAEDACAARGAESHLVAVTDRTVLRHVNYMLTSRHLREAWIGAEYDNPGGKQGPQGLDNVQCGYLSKSASKKWERKKCSEKRSFHCTYTRNRGSLTSCRYDFIKCGRYCVWQPSPMFRAPTRDWYHAKEFCLSINAELPPIGSEAEAEGWLRESGRCNVTSPHATTLLDTWTNHTNLHWHWTTGEDMKYTRWLSNSPQPQVGQCVKMTIGNHMSEIGFKSEACNKKMPAVCQISSRPHSSYSSLWDEHHPDHHHHYHTHHQHHRQTRDQSHGAPPPPNHATQNPPGRPSTPGGRSRSQRETPTPNPPRPPRPGGDGPSQEGGGEVQGTGPGEEGPGSAETGAQGDSNKGKSRPPRRPTSTYRPTYPSPTPPRPRSSTSKQHQPLSTTGTTAEVTPTPTRATPPMQWSQALIIGLVAGGAGILLLVLLVGVAVCCCCRKKLPGCSPSKHPDESTPVRPSINHLGNMDNHPGNQVNQLDNPNYDSTGDNIIPSSRVVTDPNVYMTLENNTQCYENDEAARHQYTQLQANGNRGEVRYYEIPSEKGQTGQERFGKNEVGGKRVYYSPGKKVATPLAERRLPAIPKEENGLLAMQRLGGTREHTQTRMGGDDLEYLEVIEPPPGPPGEERPSRQPSNVSQKSQDSGIDLK